jgi:hypothetical protein
MQAVTAPFKSIYANMWSEAAPEQRKLSVNLARNSLYFTVAVAFIRFFGDQLAV